MSTPCSYVGWMSLSTLYWCLFDWNKSLFPWGKAKGISVSEVFRPSSSFSRLFSSLFLNNKNVVLNLALLDVFCITDAFRASQAFSVLTLLALLGCVTCLCGYMLSFTVRRDARVVTMVGVTRAFTGQLVSLVTSNLSCLGFSCCRCSFLHWFFLMFLFFLLFIPSFSLLLSLSLSCFLVAPCCCKEQLYLSLCDVCLSIQLFMAGPPSWNMISGQLRQF